MNLFDLHSHIIWGVDDGLETKESTFEAVRLAKEDGICAICSTPHVIPGKTTMEDLQVMLYRQQELMDAVRPDGMYIYSGAEMMINYDFLQALDQGIYQTLNESRYMLVEFNLRQPIHTISYANDYLQELVDRGFVPVIAHVERYFREGLDWSCLDTWYEMGCLFQVNRTSLFGVHGKEIQKNAFALLDEDVVSLICSDMHSVRGKRIPKLSDAYEWLVKNKGEERAKQLLIQNPLFILQDKDFV